MGWYSRLCSYNPAVLINEVDGNIKNLRAMAMDLRPTFLEDSSMIQLFTLYGRLFTERTGIPVDVRGEEASDAPKWRVSATSVPFYAPGFLRPKAREKARS